MIINVTGLKGSGKSTYMNMLKERGMLTSELFSEYLSISGKKDTWEDTRLKEVYEKRWKFSKNYVMAIGGLLRESELSYLKEKDTVVTVEIKDPGFRKRYQRITKRKREDEKEYTMDDLFVSDAKRNGKFPSYEENDISRIIDDATVQVENDTEMNVYTSLVDVIASMKRKEYKKGDYLNIENQIMFTLEAIAGNRKKIISSLPTYNSVLSIGCGLGCELDMIKASEKTGVDLLEESHFSFRNFNYEKLDYHDICGCYDTVLMLRTASTRKKGMDDIKFALSKTYKQLVISYANAIVQPDGKIKKFLKNTDGEIMEKTYQRTYELLRKEGKVHHSKGNFEEFFVMNKRTK